MPTTNFPFGVSSFGVPVMGGGGMPWPVGGGNNSPGRAFFVDSATGLDSNDGLSPARAKATLSSTHTAMIANQNDVAYVIGNSSASSANVVSETATLTWSKNLCHIVGVNALNRISHRVSIRAVTNNFTPLVSVTADGCVFSNFHVFHGYATDEAQIAWAETGQRNSHFNLHIGGMGAQLAADNAGSRSLTLSGDGERYFESCTFGLDTVERGAANATIGFLGQAVRDWFENCLFISRCDAATPTHILADVSLIIDRFIYFNNCMFHNHEGTTLTEVANVHASVGGNFIMRNCDSIGATDWEAVQSTNLYVGALRSATATGLMINPTV